MNVAPYLGLRWDYRGENDGVNCWMLVRRVARGFLGRDYPEYVVPYESIGEVFAAEREHWLRFDQSEPGDVVLLTVSGEPFHAGIMLDRERFLHIPRGRMPRVERIDPFAWKRRTDGFYRCRT